MKKLFYPSAIFVFLSMLIITGCEKDQEQKPAYPLHEVLKAIVQNNTTNFSTGFSTLCDSVLNDSIEQASFSRTFLETGRFLDNGSGYLFVESLTGYNIAHPLHPELQGTSSLNQTDAYGKPIIPMMIDIVQHTGYGFLKYDYENPSNGLTESKTTFVKKIPKTNWYAGSGFYFSGNTPYYTSTEKNEKVVKEAVDFMAKGIAAVIPGFTNDSLAGVELMRAFLRNVRFFEDRSGYFFVLDYRGYNVVQPPEPEREGNYQWDLQDSRGNYLMRGLIQTAKDGGGFYSYYWLDYPTNTEKLKNAYVIQIPGYDYLIGSGVYYPDPS